MTRPRDLAPLIVDYLDRVGTATAAEIAKGIRARDADVRAVLVADSRFVGPFGMGAAPHTRKVFLAPQERRANLGAAAA